MGGLGAEGWVLVVVVFVVVVVVVVVVVIIEGNLRAGCEGVGGAAVFDELVVAVAAGEVGGRQGGGVECAEGEVPSQEHVQAVVDGLEGLVAEEDEGGEAGEDHACFAGAVPAVVAVYWVGEEEEGG